MLTLESFFSYIFHHRFSWLLVFLSQPQAAKGEKKKREKGRIISKAKRLLFEKRSRNKEGR
jgi:hypothetical protein